MDNGHTVTVDYLGVNQEQAAASCDCLNWSMAFGQGQRGDAISQGVQHIADASGRESIELSQMNGVTQLLQGQSL